MAEITLFGFASFPEDDLGWLLVGSIIPPSGSRAWAPTILPHIGKCLLPHLSTDYKGSAQGQESGQLKKSFQGAHGV